MPRGKGRKKGPSNTNALRRTTSTSRRRHPNPQPSIIGPRRSNRIAEAINHHSPSGTPNTNPMTDVARRTYLSQLSSRSHEANVSRQRTRTRPRRPESEPYGFALDFVVRPPSDVQAGSPIAPAVTLQVRTVRRGPSAVGSDSTPNRYFVVVSLIELSNDGEVNNAPPGTLVGTQLADSIHPPDSTTFMSSPSDVLGSVSFPNLVIRSPGTFRLRTSLMKVASSGGSNDGSSFYTVRTAVLSSSHRKQAEQT